MLNGRVTLLRAGTVVATGAVLALSGCGGSSSSSESSSTTAQATAQSQSARLSPASWAVYQAKGAKARAVNDAAIKTFRSCRHLVYSSVPTAKVEACLGNSTATVVTLGKQALTTLTSFSNETQGACSASSASYAGNVKVYTASVQALGRSVASHNIPSSEAAIDNSLEALKGSRAARAAFEKDCRPVA